MAYKGFKGIGPLKYGSAFKDVVTDPEVTDPEVVDPLLVDPVPGQSLISDEEVMSETIDTQYGEQPVIASDMTTGASGHLNEVVLTAGPRKKTRAEHRLDKTQSKGEAAAEAGNDRKANRLQRRKQRLEGKVKRQDSKDKKTYARKDKKYWRDQE
jgi:hypothetical protein